MFKYDDITDETLKRMIVENRSDLQILRNKTMNLDLEISAMEVELFKRKTGKTTVNSGDLDFYYFKQSIK